MGYETVLVAVDLGDECATIVERARSIMATRGRLLLMHVVSPLPVAYGAELMMEQPLMQDEQIERVRQQLHRFAGGNGVEAQQCRVEFGETRHEIHRVAEAEGASVIVVGSHGRHGLALLLGSTANEVLHGAPCDVLAVRLRGR